MRSSSGRDLASRWLVSTDWLAKRLGSFELVVIDGSNYLPVLKRNAYAEYLAGHIPGAVFFDINEIADTSTGLPHMLPRPDQFRSAVGNLGIGDRDTIVVYDGAGLSSAPRVWWTLRIFGAETVFILDGGLPKWTAEKRPIEAGEVKRSNREFRPTVQAHMVATLSDVQRGLLNGVQIVDARSAPRFRGEAPEPRPGVRSGHIPGSLNVPSTMLIEDGRLLDPKRLATAFADNGVDLEKPIITSCGSGVSAAVLWLALDALEKQPQALYDGSWAEWGSREDLPVATCRPTLV